jgi:hypothetical protein
MSQPSSTKSEPSKLPTTAAELLASLYPPLQRYWPNLNRVSAPQTAFLTLDCEEAFYGGAAGGGKSDALLADAIRYIDTPGYAALILRRTYEDLSLPGAIMDRADDWLSGSDARRGKEGKEWTFPSGATLTFGYLDNENDRYRYKSAEFQFIAFDELTQFTEKVYEYLFSRLRATEDIAVPLRMRSASNPGDIGHGWVKRRFIEDREPGVIFVPAKLDDHPDESFKAGYRRSLAKLDDVTRRQYEDGDWDAAEGLAFKYQDALHSVPAFDIPDDWQRLESLDHGLANPTCVLAWCTDYDGNLIVFDSYYSDRNQLISDHAARLLEKRREWWPTDDHDYPLHQTVCHADHDLWGRTGGETDWGAPATLLTEYEAHGVPADGFVQANKNPKAGRARLLELMKPDAARPFPAWHHRYGEVGAPRFFVIASRCRELVDQLKAAPTNPAPIGKHGAGEIVDPKTEGRELHAVASARYGALAWLGPSPEPTPEPEDPRAAAVLRMVAAERVEDEEFASSW